MAGFCLPVNDMRRAKYIVVFIFSVLNRLHGINFEAKIHHSACFEGCEHEHLCGNTFQIDDA
jgi:hypothetical protein